MRLRPKRDAGSQGELRSMMTARGIVEELIRHVDPPRGTPTIVNEAPSTKADDPNWIEYPPVMDALRRRLLSEKAAELRKSHPLIAWSDGDGTPGLRRVAMWAPEFVIVPTGLSQPRLLLRRGRRLRHIVERLVERSAQRASRSAVKPSFRLLARPEHRMKSFRKTDRGPASGIASKPRR